MGLILLSSSDKIGSLDVYINSNGTIHTYAKGGIFIEELSGNWSLIHKIKYLISEVKRKEFSIQIKDNKQEEVFDLNFYFATVPHNNREQGVHGKITYKQVISISNFIKKK